MHCHQYWCSVSKGKHDPVFLAALLNGQKNKNPNFIINMGSWLGEWQVRPNGHYYFVDFSPIWTQTKRKTTWLAWRTYLQSRLVCKIDEQCCWWKMRFFHKPVGNLLLLISGEPELWKFWAEPSRAELGHINFRAETELTILTTWMSKNHNFVLYVQFYEFIS